MQNNDERILKIQDEWERLRRKVSAYQTRMRELERKKTELENMNIVQVVRGIEVSPEELKEVMLMLRNKKRDAFPPEMKKDGNIENRFD